MQLLAHVVLGRNRLDLLYALMQQHRTPHANPELCAAGAGNAQHKTMLQSTVAVTLRLVTSAGH